MKSKTLGTDDIPEPMPLALILLQADLEGVETRVLSVAVSALRALASPAAQQELGRHALACLAAKLQHELMARRGSH